MTGLALRSSKQSAGALVCGPLLALLLFGSAPAHAGCTVIGDSVAIGVGRALGICKTWARVGISSTASASHASSGGNWVIASIGSNDFPVGITPPRYAQSVARVRAALSAAYARAGGRLILLVPANGARETVAGWAAQHGVATVTYVPGRDGIHPANYAEVASRLRAMMGL